MEIEYCFNDLNWVMAYLSANIVFWVFPKVYGFIVLNLVILVTMFVVGLLRYNIGKLNWRYTNEKEK